MRVDGGSAVWACRRKADVVLDWNAIAVNTAVANGQNPFAQARYAAIVQLAVFEAVNSITGDYRPYLGTIMRRTAPQPTQRPLRLPIRYSALISRRARRRLSTLLARIRWLSIPDGQAKTDGIATGDAAAQAMIALRANDGSSPPQFKIPGPPVPGEWQAHRLSNRAWNRSRNRLSMAVRNSIRYPECQ